MDVYCDMDTDGWGWTRYVNIKWNYSKTDALNCFKWTKINNSLLECFNPNRVWMLANEINVEIGWNNYISSITAWVSYNTNTLSWQRHCTGHSNYMTVMNSNSYPGSSPSSVSYVRLWRNFCKYSRQVGWIWGSYMNYSSGWNWGPTPWARESSAKATELFIRKVPCTNLPADTTSRDYYYTSLWTWSNNCTYTYRHLCGVDKYESSNGTCSNVGNWYYSTANNNNRTACSWLNADTTSRDYYWSSDWNWSNNCSQTYNQLCGVDKYESSNGTCSNVGKWYYSASWNNSRKTCTNYPDTASRNYTYTSDGNGTNSCSASYTQLCWVDKYESSNGTCSNVWTGKYSPSSNNTRYSCSNKPSNSYYTSDGNWSNSCGWSCNSGYSKNWWSCESVVKQKCNNLSLTANWKQRYLDSTYNSSNDYCTIKPQSIAYFFTNHGYSPWDVYDPSNHLGWRVHNWYSPWRVVTIDDINVKNRTWTAICKNLWFNDYINYYTVLYNDHRWGITLTRVSDTWYTLRRVYENMGSALITFNKVDCR